MNIYDVVKESTWETWGKSLLWLLIAGAATLPIVTSAVIVRPVLNADVDWLDLVRQGEIAICAICVVIGAVVLVARELKSEFAHRQLFMVMGICVLIAATALYFAVKAAQVGKLPVDEPLLGKLSIGVFAVSLLFGFTVKQIDGVREDFDPHTTRQEQLGDLEAAYQRIKEDGSQKKDQIPSD